MLNPDYCYIVTTQAKKKKKKSLEEGGIRLFAKMASRFRMTAEVLWFNASLVLTVVTKQALISATPKETGLDCKKTQSSCSETRPAVGHDNHRWNCELDKDHRSSSEGIAKSLHSSVRHPRAFSLQILMEAFTRSGFAMSYRRNEAASETETEDESVMILESAVIPVHRELIIEEWRQMCKLLFPNL